jgi:hypothetical protein
VGAARGVGVAGGVTNEVPPPTPATTLPTEKEFCEVSEFNLGSNDEDLDPTFTLDGVVNQLIFSEVIEGVGNSWKLSKSKSSFDSES